MKEAMDIQNGQKDKAWQIRGAEDEGKYGSNSEQYRKLGQSGSTDGSESLGGNRAVCQRLDRGYPARRNETAGGILRHLITQSRNQAARRREDIRRFQDEAQELDRQANEWEQLLKTLESTFEEPGSEN